MKIIIIGSSTGGPYILESVFSDFPVVNAAIVIVQHLPPAFTRTFASHISSFGKMPVSIASDGEILTAPHIYIAPAGQHLLIKNNRTFALNNSEKLHGVRPAVDLTMLSMQKKPDDSIMGIVLTGMGRDGADGIYFLHTLGAVTIAQDPATAPIKSMPQAAIETGKVDFILTPDKIRDAIIHF
ncbi:CheB methylesterase domain-containing protein [Methanospirillum hungatei]|uniref:CheB methylesterase domain-containing protein n=1 Tax=Methanospirillum hungatei TaxID=2203 RepID=UPI0026EAEA79|nr:CheB methylesterase domain-containing protein [Methanospirillum hungatei]MCA1917304.1 CheB methylesterase domain-containing protein [Methanospirillum hungatei]